MVTPVLFAVLVLAVAAQRLWEMQQSRHNERWLRGRGAREHAPGHFRLMQALHGAWLAGCLYEVLVLATPLVPWLSLIALAAFAIGQALRHAAMRALGPRWTVRILVLPGEPAVTHGVYRYLRHPNYAGVVLEIAALPLLHGAWRTALVFSLLNAALLTFRIRCEERALDAQSEYRVLLGNRPRFFPRWLRPRTEVP